MKQRQLGRKLRTKAGRAEAGAGRDIGHVTLAVMIQL